MAALKAADGIVRKVRSGRYDDLSQLTDVARDRIVVPGLESLGRAESSVASVFGVANIASRDIHVVRPPNTGYRAVHYTVLINRLPAEIQVMTPGQDAWAKWNHNLGYRGPRESDPNFQAYARKVSDQIFALELGLVHEDVPLPPSLPFDVRFQL